MTDADAGAPVSGLTLRPLNFFDQPALQRLLEADPGYSERVTGAPPAPTEARDLLTGRPPELRAENKCVLGAFPDEALVAVVDLLRGRPEPSTTHIGLFQVHAVHQDTGLGRRIHHQPLQWLRQWPGQRLGQRPGQWPGQWPGTTVVRAAVVATNAEHAEPFWAAMGLHPHREPALRAWP
jgi:GNAT superfamily N-acetyltransferase